MIKTPNLVSKWFPASALFRLFGGSIMCLQPRWSSESPQILLTYTQKKESYKRHSDGISEKLGLVYLWSRGILKHGTDFIWTRPFRLVAHYACDVRYVNTGRTKKKATKI